MHRFHSLSLALVLIIGISGCAAFRHAPDDAPRDLAWLNTELQAEGIFVSSQGPANLNLPAKESTRIVLSGQEVLEAYVFRNETDAREEAIRLTAAKPQQDVYRVRSLVAVRYTPRDTGISQSLRKILGRAL